jgi:HAE1 family hydrophobic/amphiphilic exporter-1
MNFSAPFINRPIATILLMVGLLLCGLATYRLLPVAALPNVNYPTILITAQLPGADPQTMASTVATPLEQQLSQIPGVTQLTSSSALCWRRSMRQAPICRPTSLTRRRSGK